MFRLAAAREGLDDDHAAAAAATRTRQYAGFVFGKALGGTTGGGTQRDRDGRLPTAQGPWVAVTEIIERGYGKTFYFHDPNGIRLQIELKTKQDADSLEDDPDPVPYVRALLHRSAVGGRSRTDR